MGNKDPSASCPYCRRKDGDCRHMLGRRDLHFRPNFRVDDLSELAELNEQFGELGDAVAAFLARGRKDRIAALMPRRLRDLVQAAAVGNEYRSFADYLMQLGKDTKIGVKSSFYEENNGPGFCSVVQMYWARDVHAVAAGMRKRITQDIRRLNLE